MKFALTFFILISLISQSFCQTRELAVIDSLFQKGNYSEIVQITDSLLSKDKVSDLYFSKLLLNRAYANQVQKNYEKAIPDWQTLIETYPDTTKYYNSLAYAYWSLDKIDYAIKTVEKAYEKDENDILTLSNLAYFNGLKQDYNACIKYASIGLKKKGLNNQQKGLLHSNRSNGYIGVKKYKKAEREATISIEYFPNNSFAFYYRAIARFGLEKKEEACSDLQKSKQLGAINLTSKLIEYNCK